VFHSCTFLSVYVGQKSVIRRTRECLEWICGKKKKLWGYFSNTYATRVFLSAFLIHFKHDRVFSVMGTLELRLLKSTRQMLESFDEVVRTIKERRSFFGVPKVERFQADLSQYFADFAIWDRGGGKAPFQAAARSALVSLYMAYFTAKEMSQASLEAAIQELRAKMIGVCGPAALDTFDGELRGGDFGLPPFQPATQSLAALHSDPSFFVLRHNAHTELVHKLRQDRNYLQTLESKMESPVFVHVGLARDRGTHWNEVMFELLSVPPVFTTVGKTLLELRARIRFYDNSWAVWIEKALAFEELSNWPGCVAAIRAAADVLRKIQMPARDKSDPVVMLDDIKTPEEMVDALKTLRRCSMNLELDFSNMRILSLSRQYHAAGATLVAQKFTELLASGAITMVRTQEWIAASLKSCVESEMIFKHPLTHMSLVKVLYYGFKQILFSPMVCNNECDLPETLLFDTWTLCSLQRKFRIDIAALCTAMNVQWLLVSLGLETSDVRDKAIKCVMRNFLAVRYGERGLDDGCVKLTLPGGEDVMERIRTELLFAISPVSTTILKSCLAGCDSPWEQKYKHTMLFVDESLRGHLVGGSRHWWAFVPDGCEAIVSRVKRNLRTVELIFNSHYISHQAPRLRPMVEAALVGSQ
jgi:hypothetical protein